MITEIQVQVPKGKLIQIMSDTEVLDSYKLQPDQVAVVTIKVSPAPSVT